MKSEGEETEPAWREEISECITAFRIVADLASEPLPNSLPSIEFLPAPHKSPSSLPAGMMAVYAFWGDGAWLKVGKVGPNSGPRYTSQHYNPNSARSNLAKSIGRCERISTRADFWPDRPGDWIRQNCHRANVFVPAEFSRELLSCLEAFMHLRLHPRYQG